MAVGVIYENTKMQHREGSWPRRKEAEGETGRLGGCNEATKPIVGVGQSSKTEWGFRCLEMLV